MKRICFFVTIISILLMMTVCVSAEDGILNVLGVYTDEDTNISEDTVITRAAFVEKIVKLTKNYNTYIQEENPVFTDVPVTHHYYDSVLSAYAFKIIYPDKNGKF